jgi:PIN domain nuclease of toxin-antitoxin system
MLVFILLYTDEIHRDISEIINDYSNTFYVSSIVAKEIIHLHKRGVIKEKRFKTTEDVLTAMKNTGIEVKLLNENHLQQYARMDINTGEHNDPNDHAIIAQSISDKIPLISSDHKFKYYIPQGLKLIFNKR